MEEQGNRERVAFVTGGARGLGAAVVRLLHAAGHATAIADIRSDDGKALERELGPRALYVELDVSDEAAWEAAVATASARFGPVDVLVNNAAVAPSTLLVDLTLGEYLRVISVNQIGVFLGMRAVAGQMQSRGTGAIVNVSSIDGIRATPGFMAYTAAKHAVVGMTRSAALELASAGVRVNAVCPGAMATPMLLEADFEGDGVSLDMVAARIPIGRMADPAEVARLITFLASDDASYLTGGVFVADGGWTAST